MKTWKTLLLSGTILAAAGTAVGVMMNQTPTPEKAEAHETEWEVSSVRVEQAFHRPEMRLVGQLEAKDARALTAGLGSDVTRVPVAEGDRVAQGDLLVQLDPFDARQQVRQIDADLIDIQARIDMRRQQHRLDTEALSVARASLARLEQRLKEQQRLVERGLTPQRQVDDLEQQVEQQRLSVMQHQTAVDNHPAQLEQLQAARQKLELSRAQAQRRLDQTRITAPFDGRVASRAVGVGQSVQPGQTLLSLFSDDALQVRVQLPHTLAGREADLGARVRSATRQSPLRFDRAEARLDQAQTGVTAWFDLVDSQGWLPGGYARVIVQQPAVYSDRVPEAAVFQDRWLYTIDADRRLNARAVDVLGVREDDEHRWLIVRGPALSGEQRLLTTRLKNPVTGMKVHEPGVDPDPEEGGEDDSEGDAAEATS